MNPYVDIHTHRSTKPTRSIWSLNNIPLPTEDITFNAPVSIGYHPWAIGNSRCDEIEAQLMKVVELNNVYAIGECGLDRTIETSMAIQIPIFQLHLKIAYRYQKPLIMHCVKAYSDLLEILNKNIFNYPVILHGFNGNQPLVNQLLKHNVFFSYGEALFKNSKKTIETIRSIPLNRLFLETDNSDIAIEDIYHRACAILGLPIFNLKTELYTNLKNIFSDELVKQD